MSSEAITRNDLTAILNEVLPAKSYQWIHAGTVTGSTNTVTIPNSAVEVMVIMSAANASEVATSLVSALTQPIWQINGYYSSSSDYGLMNLNVSNSGRTFQIRNFHWGNASYGTSGTLKVYYREADLSNMPTQPSGFGASTDIASYTSKAGAFTIPADGLIWMQCRYTNGNYVGVTVCNADGTNERPMQIVSYGTGNNTTMFPVFKGMKAWRSSNNGSNNYIDYIPFI